MPQSALAALQWFIPFTSYPADGTSETCNLCGSLEKTRVTAWDRRLKRLTTVMCGSCGLLRTDPMPTDEALARYYASHYRFDYQLAGKSPPRHHVVRQARAAAWRAAHLEALLTPGARVLDIGSGSGEFLRAAKARGCAATGIEPGEDYAAYARERHGVEVVTGGWEEAALPERAFDVITCHHVLEHLRRPVDALKKMAAWLKDDGVLYISVPDITGGEKPAYERFHFAHVYGFAPETLIGAGWAAGLVPDERFPREGTTLAFRKVRAGEAAARGTPSTDEIFARVRRTNPLAYVFGGGFFSSLIRRNARTIAAAFSGAKIPEAGGKPGRGA